MWLHRHLLEMAGAINETKESSCAWCAGTFFVVEETSKAHSNFWNNPKQACI